MGLLRLTPAFWHSFLVPTIYPDAPGQTHNALGTDNDSPA